MKQTVRESTFETNSSSIPCLTITKDANIDNSISNLEEDILPYSHLDNFSTEFITVKDKLRYLWTIRCLYDQRGSYAYTEWEEREFVDEFTSMLRMMFPKCNFLEGNVSYLEDYEYLIENPLMLDEDFIKKVLSNGRIVFTTRDYGCDYTLEHLISSLRDIEHNSEYTTIWSEG